MKIPPIHNGGPSEKEHICDDQCGRDCCSCGKTECIDSLEFTMVNDLCEDCQKSANKWNDAPESLNG